MNRITHREPHKQFLIATAITAMIAMVGLYLPVFGVVVSVFFPLPLLFYQSKLGRPWGALILIAATVILASVLEFRSLTTALFFFELGLIGLILSEVFGMNLSVERTVVVTTGVVVGTGAVMVVLYGLFSANSLWDLISDYLTRILELAVAMYREVEPSEEKTSVFAQSMEGILYVVLRIMPAVAIVSTLFVVWTNLLLARLLFRNQYLVFPDFGTLNEWKAPEVLVWVVILMGGLLLIPHKGLKLLGINGLIVMMMIYFFQGIAIVSYYFEKKRFPKLLRGLLYGLLALQQFVLLLVIVAGFFDMWIDFRRINKGVKNANEIDTQRNG